PILIGGWLFSAKAFVPKFNKLNPINGISNMFSKNSLVELFKAIAKATVVGVVAWMVMMKQQDAVIGLAVGNAMNLGTTLAVYATICKETGRPFQFPGSAAQWNGMSDVTDARMLAKQLVWAADTDASRNEAFNIVNGDVFRWSWLWPKLAAFFGVEAAGLPETMAPLAGRMHDAPARWRAIAQQHDLVELDVGRLASWWHTDADLGRPMEVMTDMGKSRKAGFLAYQDTQDAFIHLFEKLKAERIIPR
ncbi:MAG: EscU/YscU/HrcU family type III secretion system export apparatus switch protein, partial [Janthinobacterium sp.]